MIPASYFLVLSMALFVIGMFGVLTRKNGVVILMSIEIMLVSAMINFATFSAYGGGPTGIVFALFTVAIGAGEAAIGLAILLALYQRHGTIEVHETHILKW